MFTGLIEATATVLAKGDRQLTVARPAAFDDLHIGSSVNVSGACLSIVSLDASSMQFDVIAETLEKTTLGSLAQGKSVNLERALLASGRFDGHIVQGHVEGVCTVDRVQRTENGVLVTVHCPLSLVHSVIPKGSIAIDGVSLTVVSVEGPVVTVALIPHTLAETTLGSLSTGDRVNIETDCMVRALHSLHAPRTHDAR